MQGLSPRVRGNQSDAPLHRRGLRSTPACAGEPSLSLRDNGLTAVYPRVCGGTAWRLSLTTCLRGLSPRVRGNRLLHRLNSPIHRSIPACAGEPVECCQF